MARSDFRPRVPVSAPPVARYLASSSSLFIARRAVGAVKRATQLYLLMMFQNIPAFGVPTGLPSYRTVVEPLRRGA